MRLPTSAEQAQTLPASSTTGWCQDVPFVDIVCGVAKAAGEAFDFAADPLGYVAHAFNEAVVRLFSEMVKALQSTTTIDWGDPGFLRTYGMAFAVSSVLTVVLWLIAAGKRAVQGVPPLQAAAESIGYLLLAVAVSALAPAGVAYATQLFDEAAAAMFAPVAGDVEDMASTVTTSLAVLLVVPGGPVIVTFLAFALLAAIAGVWMELIVRDALILSGLVFGTSVFSGLVDRNLWGHVKRWVGVMGAVIASKYVTLTTVALATGLLASDGDGGIGGGIGSDGGEPSVGQSFATVFTAIALLWLALYLPFQIARFLPLVGDEVHGMYQARDDFVSRAQGVGNQLGDTFDELRTRSGGEAGGSEGDDGQATGVAAEGEGTEADAAEAGTSSTGVGAAVVAGRRAASAAREHAERTAERGVESASGSPPEAADGRDVTHSSATDTTSRSSSTTPGSVAPPAPPAHSAVTTPRQPAHGEPPLSADTPPSGTSTSTSTDPTPDGSQR
ncbi:hypothetical protein ACTWP5_31285 [Streptomyces sp. 4N509B]|uniref:hypothetical protein n=1 Tax=Streptomyces sp. 4N509B TaxID=3457413 RepID=UPI003FD2DFCD